ncbi:unnamed protein product [Calicophoron daubneyi]|uniref:DH domain-containing protein n=1 Tax=Calicophoron daubneyi TaxID=300641 RepID=A0AAV2TDB9_CALDB
MSQLGLSNTSNASDVGGTHSDVLGTCESENMNTLNSSIKSNEAEDFGEKPDIAYITNSSNSVVDMDPSQSVTDNLNSEDSEERQDVIQSSAVADVERALVQRKQPLMELVASEEGYVRRLRMVKECYMPVVSTNKSSTPLPADGSALASSGALPSSGSLSIRDSFAGSAQPHPPPVPDDLAARWRIVWGNWIQLYEWHSGFLEKLAGLVETDPDRIPKLFIDSRARLRSIYSKYCENHRKAALIAEQYRDYFEELRVYFGDKEDVVSYLMQPVQRIMRYQLPMAEIVKYTQRACCPDLLLWKKALDIMKEIPKDTQLILEAARIDGFPGVITALGNILIRGDLLVATTTRDQLLETVTGYKTALQEITSGISVPDSSSARLSQPLRPPQPASPTADAVVSNQPVITPPAPSDASNSGGSNEGALTGDTADLYTGSLKFTEFRLFLFEQMLVVTEEVRAKRRVASAETFAQSTYQFRAAVNVNKMRYEAHWYNCSLPNGHTNADAAAVDQLLSTGLAPDDLRFAVLDQTPGRDVVYVINPITSANREAWVVQLRDIQRMQHEFLLALQDPRRFKTGGRNEDWSKDSDSFGTPPPDSGNFLTRPDSHLPPIVTVQNQGSQQQQSQQQAHHRQRKWPSFTMKRPGRLGSTSSSTAPARDGSGAGNSGKLPPLSSTLRASGPASSETNDRPGSLARSLSAERRPISRIKLDMGGSISDTKFTEGDGVDGTYRKSSLSASSSIKVNNQSQCLGIPDTPSPESNMGTTKTGAGKKRNVFANLFGRNKSKHRNKQHTQSQQQQQQAQSQTLLASVIHESVGASPEERKNLDGDRSGSDTSEHTEGGSKVAGLSPTSSISDSDTILPAIL